jgi:hypothetical protein
VFTTFQVFALALVGVSHYLGSWWAGGPAFP